MTRSALIRSSRAVVLAFGCVAASSFAGCMAPPGSPCAVAAGNYRIDVDYNNSSQSQDDARMFAAAVNSSGRFSARLYGFDQGVEGWTAKLSIVNATNDHGGGLLWLNWSATSNSTQSFLEFHEWSAVRNESERAAVGRAVEDAVASAAHFVVDQIGARFRGARSNTSEFVPYFSPCSPAAE